METLKPEELLKNCLKLGILSERVLRIDGTEGLVV